MHRQRQKTRQLRRYGLVASSSTFFCFVAAAPWALVSLLGAPSSLVRGFSEPALYLARNHRGRCLPPKWLVTSVAHASSSSHSFNTKETTSADYSSLFSKTPTYVPSGLTVEEYQKIKQDEADRISKLQLGAWGPKFLWSEKTSAGSSSISRPPDGDWMVLPRLWTHGYGSSSDDPSASGSGRSPVVQKSTGAVSWQPRRLLRKLPAFVVAYAALEMLVRSASALAALVVNRSLFAGCDMVAPTMWLPKTVWRLFGGRVVLQAVLASVVAPPIRRLGSRIVAVSWRRAPRRSE